MTPAENYTPQQLLGKKVAFKEDAEHHSCWHHRAGLRTGVVVKIGQSLAQKAELVGVENLRPEAYAEQGDVPRLWVRADPCPSLPRGCEAAVEQDCLLVVDSSSGGEAI
jgi:hypothetical protein